MKKISTTILLYFVSFFFYGQEIDSTEEETSFKKLDSIEKSFRYIYDTVSLQNNLAILNVPKGYKFLNATQSKFVLTDLWGNPPEDVLGLLFPENTSPISDNFTYAVEITYADEGFINDGDAKDLNYDDLLEEMQNDTKAGNVERKKLGYGTVDFIGWASKPFYDAQNKKLHWAKELAFEGYETNTLNYNIRILGKAGYLNLNIIGDITVLPKVKKDVNNILSSVSFTKGNKYADFNPDYDKVAAYGIGGLIAGKVLAKAGFFVIILKFWKVIVAGFIGVFALFKKKIFGNKNEKEI